MRPESSSGHGGVGKEKEARGSGKPAGSGKEGLPHTIGIDAERKRPMKLVFSFGRHAA